MKKYSTAICALGAFLLLNITRLDARKAEPRQQDANEQIMSAMKEDTPTGVPAEKIPFDGMDLTWINGQSRQTDFPLQLNDKNGANILTATGFVDAYYNYNFNKPVDNTQTISSSIGRTNEVQLNQLSLGVESYYKHVITRLWLQYGQTASIVQDLDGTVAHGRNSSVNNLKYIREAAAGYHFDKWYGINIEAGIFMSYIGLESYVLN